MRRTEEREGVEGMAVENQAQSFLYSVADASNSQET